MRCKGCDEYLDSAAASFGLCPDCLIEGLKPKRKSVMAKYHNRKTVIDGITFDSMKEARRYQELKLMQRAGMITDLQCQVKFELIPKQKGELPVNYIADFTYWEKQFSKDVFVVEDVKGVKTREYIIKRKLLLFVHGIRIREV